MISFLACHAFCLLALFTCCTQLILAIIAKIYPLLISISTIVRLQIHIKLPARFLFIFVLLI